MTRVQPILQSLLINDCSSSPPFVGLAVNRPLKNPDTLKPVAPTNLTTAA